MAELVAPEPTGTGEAQARPPQIATIPATAFPTPTPPTPATATIEPEATDGPAPQVVNLWDSVAPQRDDYRLAVAYKGISPALGTPAPAGPAPQLGEIQEFTIGNIDTNTVSTVTAVLQGAGRHAYFWFDTGAGGTLPELGSLDESIAIFDAIYEQVNSAFGDGDTSDVEPVHIVHVSPLSLCDVTEETLDQCRLAGYFSPRDRLPRDVNQNSNEREMFVMNAVQVGRDSYLDVLAHELRHLIEARFDPSDADWAVEGSAMLAAQLAGYDGSAQWRGNLFLSDPDRQLNSWSATDPLAHYGQGYLLSRYLYDQLGADAYRDVATDPRDGLRAADELVSDREGSMGGNGLWLDWLVAMALHQDQDGLPARFQWRGPELEAVATTDLTTLPAPIDTTVNQFAADYYRLPSSGSYTVQFAGDVETALLPVPPPSGDHMWYALRSNFANPRLTRTVDLRDVEVAHLEYDAYVDIEQGYDFAYVSVSEDGGITWQPLAAEGMQGLDPLDDPSQSAVAGRFYTGRLQRWLSERVDLSVYAGKVIELRFEYITDPILTYGGFAVDDIRIPEIDFADDAEADGAGWTAEGFVRTPAAVEQSWHLWLVRFEDGVPQVEAHVPDADGRLMLEVATATGASAPILIVAAYAPETLAVADYRLVVED